MEHKLQPADWIAADKPDNLRRLLQAARLPMADDESISHITKAGEGNMNCTLRVTTSVRSIIVKQSRPWVEKYPSIAAPIERALHEMQFYRTVADIDDVASRMPKLLAADPDRYLFILEDLGAGRDGTFLYNQAPPAGFQAQLMDLTRWLAKLHQHTHQLPDPTQYANLELRTLNHAHMFDIPFHCPPVLDLDAITHGLSELAAQTSKNVQLVDRCRDLGQQYLQSGDCLLHGDFFPGSWLFCDDGVHVIDPEFCFVGQPEFDLAVCTAHLRLLGQTACVDEVLLEYERNAGALDRSLVTAWAGVEILRRLLGVAQLNLERSLEQKRALVDWAVAACLA